MDTRDQQPLITVQVDAPLDLPLQPGMLEAAIRETIHYAEAPPAVELALLLTGDRKMQDLNRQFRGVDAPTDVLSFPAGVADPDTQKLYLGDILISIDRAKAQARAGGHALEDELLLLAVHGTLHLLGYDHTEEEEKAHMWAAQATVLERLGCTIPMPP